MMFFFFFKQKTAYEMRISDWSSDVCSSDLKFIVNLSITERNFRGKGQELRASVDYSSYSKSVNLGFTEPYMFDRNIALGGDVFRRDYNSFNYIGQGRDRNTTYEQTTTGRSEEHTSELQSLMRISYAVFC